MLSGRLALVEVTLHMTYIWQQAITETGTFGIIVINVFC